MDHHKRGKVLCQGDDHEMGYTIMICLL
jgi:hypothetical protein